MRFLIDGSYTRILARLQQWPEGIAGQLITPLTGYRKATQVFAIDNGAYSSFNEKRFKAILKRDFAYKNDCLFVAIPDKVGCHWTSWKYYNEFNHLADGWNKAFVAQDGFDGRLPDGVSAIFIGGTNVFKDSQEALDLVKHGKAKGLHVHIGRVNHAERYIRYRLAGADTCDGSGVSRYDHMLPLIRDQWNAL